MRISLLIPCHNEEKAIRKSILSWLNQTRPPDEIIVVDDESTDGTPKILSEFKQLTVVRTPKNLGNKSHAQQFGLRFVHGDIVITTDADTLLQRDFVKRIEEDFRDPQVAAVGGYVKSLKYNWITRHRAFEYAVFQNLHKLAQSYLKFLFVIPGAAGAFRTSLFRTILTFDHDTITEDLDFTYKLHKNGHQVFYDRNAVVYTQDPPTLMSYVNQERRWFGGGWQNLLKHYGIASKPVQALELSMMYVEGVMFSILLFTIPIINPYLAFIFFLAYFVLISLFSVYASLKEGRADLLLAPFTYMILAYVNAYVFLEQFFVEVVFRRRHLQWFSPQRTA